MKSNVTKAFAFFFLNKMLLLNSLLVNKNNIYKIFKYIKLFNTSHSNR